MSPGFLGVCNALPPLSPLSLSTIIVVHFRSKVNNKKLVMLAFLIPFSSFFVLFTD